MEQKGDEVNTLKGIEYDEICQYIIVKDTDAFELSIKQCKEFAIGKRVIDDKTFYYCREHLEVMRLHLMEKAMANMWGVI